MSDYRRAFVPGGCYFFTAVTWRRRPIFLSPRHVDLLRAAFRKVKDERPFDIDAIVVLPDHLHCIWRLPDGDADFSSRWREIKKYVSKRIGKSGNPGSQNPLWQRRFWEHLIRDDIDWRRHMDYIHFNPVKHGLVSAPSEWPYSSFSRAVSAGWYDHDWGKQTPVDIADMTLE